MPPKRVILLGCTGSIGESTLDVVENSDSSLKIVGLAAHSQWEKVLAQAARHLPASIALSDPEAARTLTAALERSRRGGAASSMPRVFTGNEGLVSLVRETEADIVVGAISGAAGLPANLAALETGKDLALANKESLVMSGAILTKAARRRDRRILPVDSEHSAIFQCLLAGRQDDVESIILTASGGPFRNATLEEMKRATKADALKHPTWKMGAKITIDSATLMNKALEIIEAHWLFDLPPEKIQVVIHPQSIVHSAVQFNDGSMICQMGPPDMRIPIQYALTYPERRPLNARRLKLEEVATLTFQSPDPGRFPSLRLAYEVLRAGGTVPAVFNAANEVAVAAFLREEIGFADILGTVERTLEDHERIENPSLDEIFAADDWARREAAHHFPSHTPLKK